MKQITMPQVILILGLAFIIMTGVVILSIAGKDVGSILQAITTMAVILLGAFGIRTEQKLDQVKELANGRLTEIMDDNKRLNDRVAALSMMITPKDQP